ncbi:MAG: glycosyltransferase family 2 protein [bacterium]
MAKLLVIVPAYNEEKSILDVIRNIREAEPTADIMVVNDCSIDKTEEILSNNKISHISLPLNLGIGGAMQTGYIYALNNNYDFAVQVDGDGQHEPKEIKKLVAAQDREKADLVIGSRFLGEKSFRSSFARRIGINIFAFITQILTGQRITDATSGFRLVNREVIALYAANYPSDYPEPEVIVYLKNRGKKIVETPVLMKERQGGKSSITPLKSVYYMFKVISSMLMQKVRG